VARVNGFRGEAAKLLDDGIADTLVQSLALLSAPRAGAAECAGNAHQSGWCGHGRQGAT